MVIVAASDSSSHSKVVADLICDGVSDQQDIEKALEMVRPGGTVQLTEGTFWCDGDGIDSMPDIEIRGEGSGKTFLHFEPGWTGVIIQDDGVILRDLTVTGGGGVWIESSHVRVYNVTVNSRELLMSGAFNIWAENRTIRDIELNGCTARNVPGFGFWTNGRGSLQKVQDIRYFACQAIQCGWMGGQDTDKNRWAAGFMLQEKNAAENVLVKGCYAEGNWQAGFHQEPDAPTTNFVIEDCVAVNNGVKARYVRDPDVLDGSDDMVFGAGYFVCTNATVRNCTASGNYRGFQLWWGQGCDVINCTSRDSVREDYYLVHGSGRVQGNVFRDCRSEGAGSHALNLKAGTMNTLFYNFSALNPRGDGGSSILIGDGANQPNPLLPADSCFFHLNVQGGQSEKAIHVERGKNLTFAGRIATSQPYSIWIGGTDTAAISVKNMAISMRSRSADSAGIVIAPEVRAAGSIDVTNSSIAEWSLCSYLDYGIQNEAKERVKVHNVFVFDANTPYLNCNQTRTESLQSLPTWFMVQLVNTISGIQSFIAVPFPCAACDPSLHQQDFDPYAA